MNIKYYIVNPCGNITALVTTALPANLYASVGKEIMENHKTVEQVGFVEFKPNSAYLRMSGDEFCGNATLCTAALHCSLNNTQGTVAVNVYGVENPITVDVKKSKNSYLCSGFFEKSKDITQKRFEYKNKSFGGMLVKKSGISHIVTGEKLEKDFAEKFIKYYCEKIGESALGIMLLNKENNTLTPIVYVKNVDTLYYENSCGSGSCAVADCMLNGYGDSIKLTQPGGTLLLDNTNKGIKLTENIIVEQEKDECFELQKD